MPNKSARRKRPAFDVGVFVFWRVTTDADQLTILSNDVVMPKPPFPFQFFATVSRRHYKICSSVGFRMSLGSLMIAVAVQVVIKVYISTMCSIPATC